MRISELCALDWNVVDWPKGFIRVNKALTQPAKESEAPKTNAGIRDVKLLAPAGRKRRPERRGDKRGQATTRAEHAERSDHERAAGW